MADLWFCVIINWVIYAWVCSLEGGDSMEKVIGFHNPTEEYGFLSNWYLSNFTKNGIEFSSME